MNKSYVSIYTKKKWVELPHLVFKFPSCFIGSKVLSLHLNLLYYLIHKHGLSSVQDA